MIHDDPRRQPSRFGIYRIHLAAVFAKIRRQVEQPQWYLITAEDPQVVAIPFGLRDIGLYEKDFALQPHDTLFCPSGVFL